jgi:hypothetical protein
MRKIAPDRIRDYEPRYGKEHIDPDEAAGKRYESGVT